MQLYLMHLPFFFSKKNYLNYCEIYFSFRKTINLFGKYDESHMIAADNTNTSQFLWFDAGFPEIHFFENL